MATLGKLWDYVKYINIYAFVLHLSFTSKEQVPYTYININIHPLIYNLIKNYID